VRPEFDLATLMEAVAAKVPERPAIIHGPRTHTFAQLVERSRRLARYLADRGLGCRRERADLEGHEIGQDRMAQYLHNCPEYLEGLIGGHRARLAPFNVNYRYVAEELRYLLRDATPRAIQFHASFAPMLAEVLAEADPIEVLLQVDDGSGNPLLPGAVDYEQALSSVPPETEVTPSPDDAYLIYTGGTTGMPKGVLWRQADAMVALFGVRDRRSGREWSSLEEKLADIREHPHRTLLLAPYMHGSSQWGALQTLLEGNTVVIQREVSRFDPAEALDTVARDRITVLTIVGDAFGRPLADELERNPRALPSLRWLHSGGAALSPTQKQRLINAIPGLSVVEVIGSSETGVQGRLTGTGERDARPAFTGDPNTVVISEDMTRELEPGHDGIGWLATRGNVPLGYLGDRAKTLKTYPVVNGERVSLPGDRARLLTDGRVELLGRDAVTINSGGEKIFAEEVEQAIKTHSAVVDAVVCGRPSEKWGAEVVALVQLRPEADPDGAGLVAACARHIARYKLPKAVIFVDRVSRSPSGKADYKWAQAAAVEMTPCWTS